MTPHRIHLLSLVLALPLAACGDGMSPAGPAARDAGGGATGDAALGDVTYHGHVRPILAQHCEGCHVEGGIAPIPLDTYAVTRGLAGRIAQVTRERIMPPSPANASGECRSFVDARWLSDLELDTLAAWAEGGAPEGDPSTPAPPRMMPPRLEPGEATHVAALSADYTPAMDTDDTPFDSNRCFIVDAGLAEEGFLTAYEVVPGEPRVVHHAILYEPASASDAAAAVALDEADPELGYDCNGGTGVASVPVVLWAPGNGASHYPEGTGLRLGTHPMVLQIHYNVAAGSLPDRTRVELVIEPSVAQEARLTAIADPSLSLPPRQTDAPASASVRVPEDAQVWGAFPHMHQRGRTLRVAVEGSGECLVDVDRWDFDWQLGYFYEAPVTVRRGDTVRLDCTFDTMAESDVIRWGEGTGDEMCINYLYVTTGAR